MTSSVVVASSPRLFNQTQLSKETGFSVVYIYEAKRAGYSFQYGTKTTVDHFLSWIEGNPGFRSHHRLRDLKK
jgi:hypothetical protein